MKTACCLLPLASLLAAVALACPAEMKADNPARGMAGISSLYIKVELNKSVKSSSLKTGDVVEATLLRTVYSGDRELFPVGSRMRLTVNEVERRRRAPNDHWPWVIQLFTPRHENYPTFQSGSVFLTSGAEIPLRVSLVSITREREIHAQTRLSKSASGVSPAIPVQVAPASNATGLVATLEATELSPEPEPTSAPLSGRVTLPAGTQAKIILLGSVTASKSRAGDTFQARLVEPVRVGSVVELPEGTLFEGEFKGNTPPR